MKSSIKQMGHQITGTQMENRRCHDREKYMKRATERRICPDFAENPFQESLKEDKLRCDDLGLLTYNGKHRRETQDVVRECLLYIQLFTRSCHQ